MILLLFLRKLQELVKERLADAVSDTTIFSSGTKVIKTKIKAPKGLIIAVAHKKRCGLHLGYG